MSSIKIEYILYIVTKYLFCKNQYFPAEAKVLLL